MFHVCLRLALLPAVLALASCRTVKFYTQAVGGQLELLAKARPIAEVRADPGTPEKLRRQLALVEALRAFAHDELKLPTDRQYRSYADLGRKAVVWVVVAAPEFSLEAKEWKYPFVGKLKYRGWFRESEARAEAARLKAGGWDVAVGGVRVYSTLGVFSDPVLNTFVHDPEAELAETLFHELTHARFFVSGDTDFNEAYATASAQLAVKAWLRSKGDTRGLARYEAALRQQQLVLALLQETRTALAMLYAKRGSMDDDAMRREKARLIAAAQARHAALKKQGTLNDHHDGWVTGRLNNARLAVLATYHGLVPDFVRLFAQEGDDWERFHQAVEAMRRLDTQERRARLESAGKGSS